MHDSKVSEKVIWEGSISPDDETPIITSQIQKHPQMMFCYKCNNVIPGDSKFCPCCQVQLYTECPKCGVKYSSQYPACSQCGTNRQEYLQWQRKEQERKEAIEREEKEFHKCCKDYRRQLECQREQIIKTKEYLATYSVLREALESYKWQNLLYLLNINKREQYILQYVRKKDCYYDREILEYVMRMIRNPFYKYTYDVLEHLSGWCIEAYMRKHKRY